MLIGHVSVALAAGGRRRALPVWTLILLSMLLDIVWAVLTIGGVERACIHPRWTGSVLELDFAPFSHGLIATLIWALTVGLMVRVTFKLPWADALVISSIVASHWALDLIVHRPDLVVLQERPRLGLGLWEYPITALVIELALVTAGGCIWLRPYSPTAASAAKGGFVGLLLAIMVACTFAPQAPNVEAAAVSTLAFTALMTCCAFFVERRHPRSRGRADLQN